MNKILTCILLLNFISFSNFAEDKPLPPLDPAYEGLHPMVLVNQASKIFALKMTGYKKPHDYQLLYKLEVKDVSLVQLVRDSQLVTIKPKKFNLQRLIRGEKLTIVADVYSGHFDRDGMLVYKDLTLIFDKQLYVRQMKDLVESGRRQAYEIISLSKDSKLFVHEIQQAPSYAQILHIDQQSSCLKNILTTSAVPKENETLMRFINCGTLKPLYFETQDFKAKPKSNF